MLHLIKRAILPDEVAELPDVFFAEASGVGALGGGRHEIGDVTVASRTGAQQRTEMNFFFRVKSE